MDVIKPNIISQGVVSGPDKKLSTHSIRSAEARKRMLGLEKEIKTNTEKYQYKSRDKTPMVVKIAGIGVLIALAGGFLKLRLKK